MPRKKNMTTFINLTPHTINIAVGNDIIAIPPDGREARVSVKSIGVGAVLLGGVNIPIVQSIYGVVETVDANGTEVLHLGLPKMVVGVVYIVSMLVANRTGDRDDVFGPDTGPTAIRENGQIKAVRNLVKYS